MGILLSSTVDQNEFSRQNSILKFETHCYILLARKTFRNLLYISEIEQNLSVFFLVIFSCQKLKKIIKKYKWNCIKVILSGGLSFVPPHPYVFHGKAR
jgi:hypothetical protein